MNCLPCKLAEDSKIVPATHQYRLRFADAVIPFCDEHLAVFREFAGTIEPIEKETPDANP